MLKTGNGNPKKCVENLVSIIRGEVPFERVRGMDARAIDGPVGGGGGIEQEILWNIETYEPRVSTEGVTVTVNEAISGDFEVEVVINDESILQEQ